MSIACPHGPYSQMSAISSHRKVSVRVSYDVDTQENAYASQGARFFYFCRVAYTDMDFSNTVYHQSKAFKPVGRDPCSSQIDPKHGGVHSKSHP